MLHGDGIKYAREDDRNGVTNTIFVRRLTIDLETKSTGFHKKGKQNNNPMIMRSGPTTLMIREISLRTFLAIP